MPGLFQLMKSEWRFARYWADVRDRFGKISESETGRFLDFAASASQRGEAPAADAFCRKCLAVGLSPAECAKLIIAYGYFDCELPGKFRRGEVNHEEQLGYAATRMGFSNNREAANQSPRVARAKAVLTKYEENRSPGTEFRPPKPMPEGRLEAAAAATELGEYIASLEDAAGHVAYLVDQLQAKLTRYHEMLGGNGSRPLVELQDFENAFRGKLASVVGEAVLKGEDAIVANVVAWKYYGGLMSGAIIATYEMKLPPEVGIALYAELSDSILRESMRDTYSDDQQDTLIILGKVRDRTHNVLAVLGDDASWMRERFFDLVAEKCG